MIIKVTSLCWYSYIFHTFPSQNEISEPTDFVYYFQNLHTRGPTAYSDVPMKCFSGRQWIWTLNSTWQSINKLGQVVTYTSKIWTHYRLVATYFPCNMEVVTILPKPDKSVINVTQSTLLKEHINCNKHMLIYGMELASQAKRNHTKSQFVNNGCEVLKQRIHEV